MKTRKIYFPIASIVLTLIVIIHLPSLTNAQIWNSNAGGYSTGYGTVYGSFGLATATQNIYSSMQMQMQKTMARNLMIKRWGLAAVEKAERGANAGTSSSARNSGTSAPSVPKIVVPPPPVARYHGVFRPDPGVDTGRAVADALGDTPEEKALIRQIYTRTKTAYEKEAAAKGWNNNIAGGLTFFTIAAMTVYRDSEAPGDEAATTYFNVVNRALDDMPEFKSVSNRDKQAFNNTMIAFGGLVLAGYLEGKQTGDAQTVKNYGQVAGRLIKMVLKMEPDRLQIKDRMIVIQ